MFNMFHVHRTIFRKTMFIIYIIYIIVYKLYTVYCVYYILQYTIYNIMSNNLACISDSSVTYEFPVANQISA